MKPDVLNLICESCKYCEKETCMTANKLICDSCENRESDNLVYTYESETKTYNL